MPEERFEIEVKKEAKGKRIDLFLVSQNLNLSRSRIQKLIKDKKILVNGKGVKSHYKMRGYENIEIEIPPLEKLSVEPENIPLEIIYEDGDLLVVNKKKGMMVHPAGGNYSGTLVNALLYHCNDLSGINGVLRPGIVHRLDKNTTGLMVVAKNDFAHLSLAKQIKEKTLLREYHALVWGHVPNQGGVVKAPIGRSLRDRKKMAVTQVKSREALTEYEVLESFDLCDYLLLRLKTGRTHQIRVHLSHLNHPVIGDPDYGGRQKWLRGIMDSKRKFARKLLDLIDRQALHAKKLGFVHPHSQKYLVFDSPLPNDIDSLLNLLKSSW